MATFTKQAICSSFSKLLNEKPLNQITVKDIVENCGVNRKTFYYYYQDIYALIEDFFRNELERIRDELPANAGWREAQKALVQAMMKNKTALLHVYNSLDYAKLEQTAYEIGSVSFPLFIREQPGGAEIGEGDLKLISDLSSYAMAGFVARWVRDGMKSDPNELIDRAASIMKGTVELAVSNALKLKEESK